MSTDPDPVYSDVRLVELYDLFDGRRDDLDLYVAIAEELDAQRVLDLGCGTGALAIRLHSRGCDLVGVDPAAASIGIARAKPAAERISWVIGDATTVAKQPPERMFDLAVSTGNAIQGIVNDEDWATTLRSLATVVRPGGHLVFETRIPERRAWEHWTPEASHQRGVTPAGEVVETWNEVVAVELPLVTFEATFEFPDDTIVSRSVLRFRTAAEVTEDLERAGFFVRSIRDAPDRPDLEWVFVAECVDLR